nr:DinB family protein [Pedobacter sp. ASV2]
MFNITAELRKAYNGDAWHGSHIMQILNQVKPENAFKYFIIDAHSIAEITLHLTSWTEEVSARLLNKIASEPALGDWPIAQNKTIQGWEKIIFDFKIANEELIRICDSIKDQDWHEWVKSESNPALGKGIDKIELLNGLVQHHAYHAGQIAILSKF